MPLSAFEKNLSDLLKWFDPNELIPAVTRCLLRSRHDLNYRTFACPHFLLHLLEADCAYWNSRHHLPVTDHAIDCLISMYHEREPDPIQTRLLDEGNIDAFFRLIHREQAEVQVFPGGVGVTRSLCLFVENDPMLESGKAFKSCYGFTFCDWHQILILVYSLLEKSPDGISLSRIEEASTQIGIEHSTLLSVLRHSWWSTQSLGTEYRRRREEIENPALHPMIPTCLLSKPLIILDGGRVLAPQLPLLHRHLWSGLKSLGSSSAITVFNQELGRSFERYIKLLLDQISSIRNLVDPSTLRQIFQGQRHCDFVVEFDDCLVLIESKATTFTRLILTPDVMAKDSSSEETASALQQFLTVQRGLEEGKFSQLLSNCDKPLYVVTLTLGEIPRAGGEQYWREVILRDDETLNNQWEAICEACAARPQVMSIEAFEYLTMGFIGELSSYSWLIEQKENEEHGASDWVDFLPQIIREQQGRPPDILNEIRNTFMQRYLIEPLRTFLNEQS